MTSLLKPQPFFTSTESLPDDSGLSSDAQLLRQIEFIPGLRDLLLLRQVHALEHATIWVLSGARPPLRLTATAYRDYSLTRSDDGRFSGFSTSQGFYLTGDVSQHVLRRASALALKRLSSGEWDLAVHPRCSTNLSVTAGLMAGFTLAMHLLMPRRPVEQLAGLGMAAAITGVLTPAVGAIAQRYLTTSIPANLAIESVYPIYGDEQPAQGRSYFVRVRWVDG